jgi:hypothetical protein
MDFEADAEIPETDDVAVNVSTTVPIVVLAAGCGVVGGVVLVKAFRATKRVPAALKAAKNALTSEPEITEA